MKTTSLTTKQSTILLKPQKTKPPPPQTKTNPLAELTIDDIGQAFGPSSPLSTSTLSGSGGTVIQVVRVDALSAGLPLLSASRTSTPLKVVQPAGQMVKHGFHVAAPRFTGDQHHHDNNNTDNTDDYMECSPAGTKTL